ncbi:MAG: hypothetical protein IJU51_01950, partial [Clostridia bacterium]|nr:hypothetical protein [Clostridia bacterium]
HPLRSAEAKSVSLSAESESRGTFAEKSPLTIPENELFPFLVSRIQVLVRVNREREQRFRGARVSGGDLCAAEAPTEPTGETRGDFFAKVTPTGHAPRTSGGADLIQSCMRCTSQFVVVMMKYNRQIADRPLLEMTDFLRYNKQVKQ